MKNFFEYDDERIVCPCCRQLKPMAEFNRSSSVCDQCAEQMIDKRQDKSVRQSEVDELER